MRKSNFVWVLDNGHGGLKHGEYVTAPRKMYKHEDGTTVFEGVFNRTVVKKITYLLSKYGIEFEVLVPEQEDISLSERKKRANEIHAKSGKRSILVSVHGNAGKGTGFEVFTTKGQTASDTVAEIFIEEIEKVFPTERKRVDITDGDQDKEANFTVLMCDGPAILTENFFMDNLKDAKLMTSDEGQTKIALAHVEAIKRIESQFANISEMKPTKAEPVKKKAATKKKTSK